MKDDHIKDITELSCKGDNSGMLLLIALIAFAIAVMVIPKLRVIIEKLDAIEQKIQPNEVVLPKMSGKRDQECRKYVEEDYQVEEVN